MAKAIGVDLGGTKIEAALVDEEGGKIDCVRMPTDASRGWRKTLQNLEKAVARFKGEEYEGIGIGAPGFVYDGMVNANPNVPELKKVIDEFRKNHKNCILENDANCFAIAEHRFGAGKRSQNMIGVIWGTGIGGGIIVDGKLMKGKLGGAGEIGHTIINHGLERFRPGGDGTWEHLCSGPNIVRRYKELGGPVGNEEFNPRDIFESDHIVAKKIKEETLKLMGVGLGNLVNIFNPGLIVMGGGVSNLDIYKELNDSMRKFSISALGDACRVVKNKLGDSAGVLGAASLVFDRK